MSVSVVTAPSPIITLDEAKMHVRVDGDGGVIEDNLIKSYIAAATAWLDGPNGWLGRALGVQELEWSSDRWPCALSELPCPPLIEIVSIKYVGADSVESEWPLPEPLSFDDVPTVRGRAGDVKIRYRAGYGKRTEDTPPQWVNFGVPEPIRVAILMLVSQWYYNRDAVSESLTPQAMPFGVDALVIPYRLYRW